jgi:hypothetical protein
VRPAQILFSSVVKVNKKNASTAALFAGHLRHAKFFRMHNPQI